jgi:hypothetical protein
MEQKLENADAHQHSSNVQDPSSPGTTTVPPVYKRRRSFLDEDDSPTPANHGGSNTIQNTGGHNPGDTSRTAIPITDPVALLMARTSGITNSRRENIGSGAPPAPAPAPDSLESIAARVTTELITEYEDLFDHFFRLRMSQVNQSLAKDDPNRYPRDIPRRFTPYTNIPASVSAEDIAEYGKKQESIWQEMRKKLMEARLEFLDQQVTKQHSKLSTDFGGHIFCERLAKELPATGSSATHTTFISTAADNYLAELDKVQRATCTTLPEDGDHLNYQGPRGRGLNRQATPRRQDARRSNSRHNSPHPARSTNSTRQHTPGAGNSHNANARGRRRGAGSARS